MNFLGQIRTLLEIQSFRNLSGKTNQTIYSEPSLFNNFLQKALLTQQLNKPNHIRFLNMETLGAIQHLNQLKLAPTPQVKVESGEKTNSIERIVQQAASQFNIPEKLIKAVIRHESNFNPQAVSRSGASGLMQLMPATARGLGVTNVFDPKQNIMAGSKYLRDMLNKYNGDIELALAAYNAGPGNVDKYGGVPPFKETKNYISKIISTYYSA